MRNWSLIWMAHVSVDKISRFLKMERQACQGVIVVGSVFILPSQNSMSVGEYLGASKKYLVVLVVKMINWRVGSLIFFRARLNILRSMDCYVSFYGLTWGKNNRRQGVPRRRYGMRRRSSAFECERIEKRADVLLL